MNEQELRALVREAVERHLGQAPGPGPQAPGGSGRSASGHGYSHGRFLTLVKASDACFIEPAVRCNHCGYCESHGH